MVTVAAVGNGIQGHKIPHSWQKHTKYEPSILFLPMAKRLPRKVKQTGYEIQGPPSTDIQRFATTVDRGFLQSPF